MVKAIADLWQLKVDLATVELEKLSLDRGRYHAIVLEHGKQLASSHRNFKVKDEKSRCKAPDRIPVSWWDRLIVGDASILSLYPNVDTFPEERLDLRNERSVKWSFDDFLRDNSGEIHSAVVYFVMACNSSN